MVILSEGTTSLHDRNMCGAGWVYPTKVLHMSNVKIPRCADGQEHTVSSSKPWVHGILWFTLQIPKWLMLVLITHVSLKYRQHGISSWYTRQEFALQYRLNVGALQWVWHVCRFVVLKNSMRFRMQRGKSLLEFGWLPSRELHVRFQNLLVECNE